MADIHTFEIIESNQKIDRESTNRLCVYHQLIQPMVYSFHLLTSPATLTPGFNCNSAY